MKISKLRSKSHTCCFVILAVFCLTVAGFGSVDAALKNEGFKNNRQTNPRSKIKIKRKGETKSKMSQPKLLPVATGVWGTEGVALAVEESRVKIEYPCAESEISQKLTTDAQGNFNVVGIHTRQSPGAVRLDSQPQPQPARFEGKISDKTMTLKVTLIEGENLIGEFTLELGKVARLYRCL